MKTLIGEVVASETGRQYRVIEVSEQVISIRGIKNHTILAVKAQDFLELFPSSMKI